MHLRASRIPRAQTAAARFTLRKSRCDIPWPPSAPWPCCPVRTCSSSRISCCTSRGGP